MTLTIGSCPGCGAITLVSAGGITHADQRDAHREWHERLRAAISNANDPVGTVYPDQLKGI